MKANGKNPMRPYVGRLAGMRELATDINRNDFGRPFQVGDRHRLV